MMLLRPIKPSRIHQPSAITVSPERNACSTNLLPSVKASQGEILRNFAVSSHNNVIYEDFECCSWAMGVEFRRR